MKNRLKTQILILMFAALAFMSPLQAAVPEQLDCVIEPGMVVELSSRIDGILESLNVERGDWVEADEEIARLESGAESAGEDDDLQRAKIVVGLWRLRHGCLMYGERPLVATGGMVGHRRSAVLIGSCSWTKCRPL